MYNTSAVLKGFSGGEGGEGGVGGGWNEERLGICDGKK